MKHVLILLLLFAVSSLAQATTVRCYFPGYSESYKDVSLAAYAARDQIEFTLHGKRIQVPVNACVIEEDL